MEENKGNVETKVFNWHKYHTITDIILIIILLLIAWYVVSNIESFKALNKDVCAYCMKKTGAYCYTTDLFGLFGNKTENYQIKLAIDKLNSLSNLSG
jgi:hypothetical protein